MTMESPRRPEAAHPGLDEAVVLLRRGGLVAFPTETVYGLGADALNPAALARIFAAKGRPRTNPLILHVSGIEMAQDLVAALPPPALRLMEAFWPGPLTLVLPRGAQVPDAVTAGGPTVALRMPDHPLALALLRAFGGPLAAPSANRSEHVSPTTAAHVRADLGDRIDLILDGGPCRAGLESTVVDLSGPEPRLLRHGPLPPGDLAAVLGREPLAGSPGTGVVRSPGQSRRHYAPKVPLVLRPPGAPLPAEGPLGWLSLEGDPTPGQVAHRIPMGKDPVTYGRELYAALRTLEALPLRALVADLPPASSAWAAVQDRLARAAAPPATPLPPDPSLECP